MAIRTEITDHILRIQIDRPEKRNMLDRAHLDELREALESARGESPVRVVFLEGVEGVFCAGEELQEEISTASDGEKSPALRFLHTLSQMERPVVACVQGPAVGLGAAMLYYCDLVYTGPQGLFAFPFTALGLTPRYGLTALVQRHGGMHKACEKLLCSEPITAQEAVSLRLVTSVYPQEEVRGQAWARAVRLSRLPQAAVLSTKFLLRQAAGSGVAEAGYAEERAFLVSSMSPDAKEACAAFLEGRMPSLK